MLHRARQEAAVLVMSAKEAAAAREAALAANVDAICDQLEATIEAERQRQEREVAQAAQREAWRFDQTGPEQIDGLARYVVERAIGVGA
jgi:hypothetical protein